MKQTLSFQVKIKDKKVVFENRKYFDWMIAKTFKDGETPAREIPNSGELYFWIFRTPNRMIFCKNCGGLGVIKPKKVIYRLNKFEPTIIY